MQAAMKFQQFDINGDGELSAGELVSLATNMQETLCMSVPGLYLLPPKKKYTIEYIKNAMMAFNDARNDQHKTKNVKRMSSTEGSNHVRTATQEMTYLQFDRREFMTWFSKEHNAYRDVVGDGKPQGWIMRKLMLDEVVSYFAAEEKTETKKSELNGDDGGDDETKNVSEKEVEIDINGPAGYNVINGICRG